MCHNFHRYKGCFVCRFYTPLAMAHYPPASYASAGALAFPSIQDGDEQSSSYYHAYRSPIESGYRRAVSSASVVTHSQPSVCYTPTPSSHSGESYGIQCEIDISPSTATSHRPPDAAAWRKQPHTYQPHGLPTHSASSSSSDSIRLGFFAKV